MPNFTVIAFYTKNTPYEEEVIGLQRTCKARRIPCVTRGYKNRGKWVRNAAIKPEFILEMLRENPGKRLIYIDADARIKKYPILFDTLDGDFAVHHRDRRELLSGTIFMVSNERTCNLVEAWVEQQQNEPETWDQRVLAKLLDTWSKPLKLVELPAQYCQIFDSMKSAGSPVVEHLQASRRFKKLIGTLMAVQTPIPAHYQGIRIRQSPADGSYWIPRQHRATEKFMDARCIRIPGTLRWTPRFVTDNRIDDLRPIFKGHTCYIIGKGPSLDHLRAEHFVDESSPVIALNEAIYEVENLGLKNPVYGLQQDAKLRATCLPREAPIFVSTKAANYYADCERMYIFQNTLLGLNRNALSVSAAIVIAKMLGCVGFVMICFDACVNKNLEYAECIGYKSTWGGVPQRFLRHRSMILKHVKGAPLKWITPEAPAEVVADIPQQS